jgi:hypothetical protein
MRKGLASGDETLNGFNNRQTAAIILTFVIGLPFRSPDNIELHDRGPIFSVYTLLPPKLRNLGDVPPYYIHNRREFAIKSCLRELFGEKIKGGKNSGSIAKMKKKKEILRTGRLN